MVQSIARAADHRAVAIQDHLKEQHLTNSKANIMTSVIMTLVGPDRPGLVEKVSDVVTKHDGNWLESRMAHLAGQFAGIVRIDVDSDNLESLTSDLNALSDHQLTVVTVADNGAALPPLSKPMTVQVVGNDRPGIVKRITSVLSSHDVNVEELTTECMAAPHSGGSIFQATARLRIPEGMSTELLQDELERIATDLMIDITVE